MLVAHVREHPQAGKLNSAGDASLRPPMRGGKPLALAASRRYQIASKCGCRAAEPQSLGLSDPGDKAVEHTHSASLMKSAVGGYETAPVSGGNRQVEAVVYGDTVRMASSLVRRPPPDGQNPRPRQLKARARWSG
jgi:hypothetical protein